MDFFQTVENRRSIRQFTEEKVPEQVIEKALDAAFLAPNSSNAQTWDFYWVQSDAKRKKLIQICLNQSAARTAAELIVVVASPSSWRRSWPFLKDYIRSVNAPKGALHYYEKLFPIMYRSGPLLSFLKWFTMSATALFRPMMRRPNTLGDLQEVSLKSAALAAENLVLALTAQGYASCMMEGFDEGRAKSLLSLKSSDRIAMVIAIGRASEKGPWGPRFRIPRELVIHKI